VWSCLLLRAESALFFAESFVQGLPFLFSGPFPKSFNLRWGSDEGERVVRLSLSFFALVLVSVCLS
jgi:hypothetical protein